MLVQPEDWCLAHRADDVLASLPEALELRVSAETHNSALEIQSGPHADLEAMEADLTRSRGQLQDTLAGVGLRAAAAGLHPFAVWNHTEVSAGERYQRLHLAMRELVRREPTFALHVHVAVPDAETAVTVMNRMAAHLPLLLALSANSPFWQGRDTGLASARTPLFQAFPRVGIPRRFDDYAEYVDAVDLLVRCGAIPDPSHLWWDVRPQPLLGTLEVRIMDAQSSVSESCALAAFVCALMHAEARSTTGAGDLRYRPEVLIENRFLAARDGMHASLVDPSFGGRRPARELLAQTLEFCRPSARELGCTAQLERIAALGAEPGSDRQRQLAAERGGLPALVGALSDRFCPCAVSPAS